MATTSTKTPGLSPALIRDDQSKLSDRVAIELGSRIVQGHYEGRERLPTEADLCTAFGVSRSVIRDAIRTLSARGLVEVRQGHGMEVTDPSAVPFAEALVVLLMRSSLTVGDIQDARAAIETELVPLAAARSLEADWHRMDRSLADYRLAVESSEWDAAHVAHLDFHYSLIEAIHLPALEMMLRPMQQIISLTSTPISATRDDQHKIWTIEDVELHYPIVAAVRNRDTDASRRAMETHFVKSGRLLGDRYEFVRSQSIRESPAARNLLDNVLRRP